MKRSIHRSDPEIQGQQSEMQSLLMKNNSTRYHAPHTLDHWAQQL